MRQNLSTLWNSIDRLPKRLRLLSLAVLILIGINLAITYQLSQDVSTQQQRINDSFKPIRTIANLQYSHLQLAALLENGSRHFNRRAYIQQIEEVERQITKITDLTSGVETTTVEMPVSFHKTLQTYTIQWNNIRPSLIRWGERPTNNYLRQILLVSANTQDSVLGELGQIAEDNYQEQRTNTENSTRATLAQLAATSIIWSALLGLFAINILGFMREQRRTEAELLEAKELADAAHDAKSAFLSNMSHEMRTPMNAILNMTTFALDEAESTEQRSSLQLVKESSEALLLLINNTLDISKIEAGALTLHVEPFDPRELVKHITALFTLQAKENGILLKSTVDPDVPTSLTGDQNRLRQILLNVVGNAVKFTTEGEVSISVCVQDPVPVQDSVSVEHTKENPDTQQQASPNQAITLLWTIRDSGIGIPKEKHQSIFDAFQQVDNSSTRSYDGTGLGLTISKQLLELMNGEIYLESAENNGSTFYITTPLGTTTQLSTLSEKSDDVHTNLGAQIAPQKTPQSCLPLSQTDQTQTAQKTAQNGTATTNKRADTKHRIQSRNHVTSTLTSNTTAKRILLVEDNLINQKVILTILQRAGYQVDLAHTGVEALQKLEVVDDSTEQFDLILMDLQMPQMNGFDATKAIRAKEANTTEHIPIIALTANVVSGVKEECIQAGMDEYMTKPIQTLELIETIQRFTTVADTSSELRV